MHFAQDGVTGLSMAQQEQPNLILLNLGLPTGDGMTVLQRLKRLSRLANLPVLVVTRCEADSCKDDVMQAQASGFLQKPLKKESFLSAVC